jgi:predicted permease
VLNVFALHFGFPALILVGVVDPRFDLPTSVGFWLMVPLSQAVLVLGSRLACVARGVPSQAGTLALVTLFGNVAYLGLPLAGALFGAELQGVVALAVSIYVAIAVLVGPVLLGAWSGGASPGANVGRVLRQPLLFAPFVGLLLRGAPPETLSVVEVVTRPIANAAAPVALFLLGLYLYERRDALWGSTPGASSHVAVRLVLAPLWTLACAALLVRFGDLSRDHGRVFVVLAGMPAAVTTFSIAISAGVGEQRVAAVVVRSSLACLVTLPLTFTIAQML